MRRCTLSRGGGGDEELSKGGDLVTLDSHARTACLRCIRDWPSQNHWAVSSFAFTRVIVHMNDLCVGHLKNLKKPQVKMAMLDAPTRRPF
ncbi:hypothetical protein Ae201684_009262 [Aphanomyces euteiches]|uniref:Uncharacterized protein n=1 Tax=Aphanomyces euteiches TaxID=100861 RepID=A0A6G0X2I8_9STRA|nr:hypothetical protein Ae201684_009262 [Aphanomyces euteiches]